MQKNLVDEMKELFAQLGENDLRTCIRYFEAVLNDRSFGNAVTHARLSGKVTDFESLAQFMDEQGV